MQSGIFAVATIGQYRLYVGESHQLKERWAKMLVMFDQGKFPSERLQSAWKEFGEDRKFTFHTADQISGDPQLFGYRQFLKDTDTQNK